MKSLLLPMIGLTLFAGCAPRTDEAAQAAEAPAAATALEDGRAKLYVVMGQVRKETGGGWVNTGRGTDFVAGDAIVTGDDGNALLVFTNGARLLVRPNTELRIEQISFAPFDQFARGTFLRLKADPSKSVVRLVLRRGSIWGDTQELFGAVGGPALGVRKNQASSFLVQTPAGEVDVLGGYFGLEARITVSDGGPSVVTAGSALGAGLLLTSLNGREAVIPAGTEMDASVQIASSLRGQSVRFSQLRCFLPRSEALIQSVAHLVNTAIENNWSTTGAPIPPLIPPTPAPCPLKQ